MNCPTTERVLMIAPTPFFAHRGTHIRILEEARAVAQRGHDVSIFTYHIGTDVAQDLLDGIRVYRIRRFLFWYKKLEAGPNWQKVLLDLLLFNKVLWQTLWHHPTVLHGHLHEGVLIGWLVQHVLFWKRMRLIADFHGGLTDEMISHDYLRSTWMQHLFRNIERWIDNAGDVALASSPENKRDLQRLRHVATPLYVLLDGVNLNDFSLRVDRQQLREQFNLPQHKTILCYTGAFSEPKGIHYLIEALPLLQKAESQLHVVLGGYPTEGIQAVLDDPTLKSFVSVISPVDYFVLPKLLLACDIAIDPKDASSHQASGKILHYMAAGLPVICCERETNRMIVGDGGVYVTNPSGSSIAAAVLSLLERPVVAQTLGRNNRARVEQFHWRRAGRLLEILYA